MDLEKLIAYGNSIVSEKLDFLRSQGSDENEVNIAEDMLIQIVDICALMIDENNKSKNV